MIPGVANCCDATIDSKNINEVNIAADENEKGEIEARPEVVRLRSNAPMIANAAEWLAAPFSMTRFFRPSPLSANRPRLLECLMTQRYNLRPIT